MEVRNLRAYLANIGMQMKDFAKLVDCHPTYLSHIVTGRRMAGNRLAKDIRQATNGIISLPIAPKKYRKTEHQQQDSNEYAIAGESGASGI